MSNNLSYYLSNKLIDHANGKASYTMPTVYVSLSVTTPTPTTSGTEYANAGSYARVQISGVTFTATVGGTGTVLTTASTTGLVVGMTLTGAGIASPTNYTIVSINPNVSVTVNSSITGWTASVYTCGFWNFAASGASANSGAIVFPTATTNWGITQTAGAFTSASATVPFANTTNVAVGQFVTGAGITGTATVISFVSNTSVTLSQSITWTATAYTFAAQATYLQYFDSQTYGGGNFLGFAPIGTPQSVLNGNTPSFGTAQVTTTWA